MKQKIYFNITRKLEQNQFRNIAPTISKNHFTQTYVLYSVP